MDKDELVQVIVVVDQPGLIHEKVVWHVADASVRCLVDIYNQSVYSWSDNKFGIDLANEWLKGRFTKSVRKIKKPLSEYLTELHEAEEYHGYWWHSTNYHNPIATALSPMGYDDLPAKVKRAQVQSTDYPYGTKFYKPLISDFIGWKVPNDVVFAINEDIEMSTGKTAAQLAHAYMKFYIENYDYKAGVEPPDFGFVYRYDFDDIESDLVITDAGLTEIDPGTQTVKLLKG